MLNQREGYRLVILEPAKSRIARGECAACGMSKDKWARSTRWTCCSPECTTIYLTNYYCYGWPELRMKAFRRDGFKCVRCGLNPRRIMNSSGATCSDPSQLIADHIIPIALGGAEWDLENIQTLCLVCNKTKTAIDHGHIAHARRALKPLEYDSEPTKHYAERKERERQMTLGDDTNSE